MTRFSWSLLFVLSACAGPAAVPPDAPTCNPDPAAYEASIRPRVERYCGGCHGATPDFGAPTSLLDAHVLLAPRATMPRIVDRMATRLVEGSMPPVGMPRIPDADAQAIVDWASCHTMEVPRQTGLRVDAPVYLSPTMAPSGLQEITLGAQEFPVGADVIDLYQCFVFDVPLDGPRFIRRFEINYGETRVLHHLVMLRDPERHTTPGNFECQGGNGMPPGSQYLYSWAPGLGPVEFPDGGLRVEPNERFIVQLHYNNGAHVSDVRDSSGVRVFLGPPEGTEYALIAPGPLDFQIPGRDSATITGRCTFTEDTEVLATWPHMHRLGSSFSQVIERQSGARENHIRLDGWQFDAQLLYATPRTLQAGDAITTSCSFINPNADTVMSGARTEDEMCFGFMYVTPPRAGRYCNEGDAEVPTDITYVPTQCAPEGAPTDVPLVRGSWMVAESPPQLSVGTIPDGRWVLESQTFYVSGASTPIGDVDFEATYVLARGQVWTEGNHLIFDMDANNFVQSIEGVRFGGPNSIGFSGTIDPSMSRTAVTLDCPSGGAGETIDWGIEGDLLTIGFESEDVPSRLLWPRYTFRRVP